jgi:signal transduction histidine kinase
MSQVLKVSISKSATLSIDLATDLGLVRGNAAQLKQLIMNLVVNASQAIGDREGRIRIRATMLTPEQRMSFYQASPLAEHEYVQIEILDDGTGMPEEIKGRIFDAFFTTKPDGRGLGLAVAQCVVRAHGGIATVVSAPGQGTTFRVLLPCLPRILHATGESASKTGSWESPSRDSLTIAG